MPLDPNARSLLLACVGIAALGLHGVRCPASPGEIAFSVSINDPAGEVDGATRAVLIDHVAAAGAAWDEVVVGAASIEVAIDITTAAPRATGASVTSSFVGFEDGFDLFEQAMAAEIQSGIDPNGATADVRFELNPDYLRDELWLDPDPFARVAPVPADRTDAMSVFVHEFGHAIAYNGWLNGFTGDLPGDLRSTWDQWVTASGGDFFFAGPNAVALVGEPLAVTFGNPNHLGNNPPRAGEELIGELMNGVVFFRGVRYDVGPIDRAVLADARLTLAPGVDGVINAADYTVWRDAQASATALPEPAAWLGLLSVVLARRHVTPAGVGRSKARVGRR